MRLRLLRRPFDFIPVEHLLLGVDAEVLEGEVQTAAMLFFSQIEGEHAAVWL